MLRLILRVSSLRNLSGRAWRRPGRGLRGRAGQMATFFILIIVAVIIFTMFTANLGQAAVMATNMSNAADAAALLLGSQLASQSSMHYESLGWSTERCFGTGALGGVLAMVFALLATIFTAGAGLAVVIPAASAAGAAGGAIGNEIVGLDAGAGALQGAISGAAIGTGAVVGKAVGAALTPGATTAGQTAGTTAGKAGGLLGKVAGKAVGGVGKAVSYGGQAVTAAGNAISAGGQAMIAAGKAMIAAGAVTPVVGPVMAVIGYIMIAIGYVLQVIGWLIATLGAAISYVGDAIAYVGDKIAGVQSTAPTWRGPEFPALPSFSGPAASPAGTSAAPPAVKPTTPSAGKPMAPAGGDKPPAPGGETPFGKPLPEGGFAGPKGAVIDHSPIMAGNPELASSMGWNGGQLLETIPPLQPVPAGVNLVSGSVVPSLTGIKAGAIGNAAMSAAGPIMKGIVRDEIRADMMANAAKVLNGLPDGDRIAQGVIFDAMLRVVDDPARERDDFDINGNGDMQEFVPRFGRCWYRHTRRYFDALPEVSRRASDFVNGPLKRMEEAAQEAVRKSPPGLLSRLSIEGSRGSLENLTTRLYNANPGRFGPPLAAFWLPGPTGAQLQQHPADCSTCPPPPGWDETDQALQDLKEFIDGAQSVRQMDERSRYTQARNWAPALTETIRWLNPDGGRTDTGLQKWRNRLTAIKQSLDPCRPDPVTNNPGNYPCREPASNRATVDANLADDEFAIVDQQLRALQLSLYQPSRLDGYLQEADRFIAQMVDPLQNPAWNTARSVLLDLIRFMFPEAYIPAPKGAAYVWEDNRGAHRVEVWVGPFPQPTIGVKSKGNFLSGAKCMVLKQGEDQTGLLSFVIIRRTDTPRNNGNLGLWNWNAGQTRTVTRMSATRWSYDHVHLTYTSPVLLQPLADTRAAQRILDLLAQQPLLLTPMRCD